MPALSRCLRSTVLALCWLAAAGCASVREEVKPLADTTLIVTRAGDQMTLSWASAPDVDYTIWFTDRRAAQSRWQVLPGATRVRGTGQQLTWRDRVPTGQNRYYRLQAVPQAARAP